MNEESVWVVIKGEPFLSRAKEHRDALIEYSRMWGEFARNMGAQEPSGAFPGKRPAGLVFSGAGQRSGWTKINNRGFSRPKRGHKDEELWAGLPAFPNPRYIFGDIFVEVLSYEMPGGGWGSRCIGPSFGPRVGWADNEFVALVAHAGNAARRHLEEHPDHNITTKGAVGWVLPEGLVEISQAEKDLIYARHAVEREKRNAA